MAQSMFSRHRDVLWYIPNLIGELWAAHLSLSGAGPACCDESLWLVLLGGLAGYARIGLTLGALACARQYPLLCVTTYFLA
jgi:hypothetical protein